MQKIQTFGKNKNERVKLEGEKKVIEGYGYTCNGPVVNYRLYNNLNGDVSNTCPPGCPIPYQVDINRWACRARN